VEISLIATIYLNYTKGLKELSQTPEIGTLGGTCLRN
jgi:hypothetical protein